ncbi:MAG: hypothetical protein KGD67_13020, partial [Candidatus Lokiarchaeota archaeon]|nr:hypothetical protein [Candidatus Lokiarchaeota archaeon]
MNDEFTIFYTNVDNVKKECQKIPANLYRRFGRGGSLSSYERFKSMRFLRKVLYLKTVQDYIQLFVTDDITDIVFFYTSDYSDFVSSEKIKFILKNIT